LPQMSSVRQIVIVDSTLRDGNHAVRHQLDQRQIGVYAAAADAAGVPVVVVGHGNGLGASSLQVGQSALTDVQMLEAARDHLHIARLGVFSIPGFATINEDLRVAADLGAAVFCIGAHCTEADTTQRHITYARERGRIAYGNLLMTHMVEKEVLLEECLKMQSYGAQGVIIMDSAGYYLPEDVERRIAFLVAGLSIPVGFHAHNNLGMAVANSVAAVKAGATIIDCCARGFGAGAGNAPLEVVVAVLQKMGWPTGIDLYKVLDCSDIAEDELMETVPTVQPVSIVSGLAGVFSGFAKHVQRISAQYGIDPRDVFFQLGRRKVVAGQEDLIIEVALQLLEKKGIDQPACKPLNG
jgi:4-hydroxy 2-oxovalerate aldolase